MDKRSRRYARCGDFFYPKLYQRFCSDTCKDNKPDDPPTQTVIRRKGPAKPSLATCAGLSIGTTGAIGELRVSVDLLIKGYEVFRAVSHSCSCDLIAIKQSRALRIEVRTTSYRKDGTPHFPGNPNDEGKARLLLCCCIA